MSHPSTGGSRVAAPPQREGHGPASGGDASALPAGSGRRGRTAWRQRFEITVLTGPALIVFLGFVIAPVIVAAYCGFFNWNGYGPLVKSVGFDNYIAVLKDKNFYEALGHNIFIVVMSLLCQGPLALLVALLLNKKMKGRSALRVLLFVPYVISEAIIGVGWRLILGTGQTGGALNALLDNIGLGWLQHYWLDNGSAIWVLLGICTWKYLGYAIILFLAGMQGIPEELSEAAAIDGASYWKTQWHITLPLLGPTLRIWAFLSIIGSLQLFDLVYVIWGKAAQFTGVSTMASYMVQSGRDMGRWGYGNAVAVVMFLISLVIALAYQRFVLRRDTEGSLTEGR
ncbi:MAG: sugar ABC transporter permease [Propionibacteriaceae bacterium]|jgi:ABC-type sugar transport system permease subunit|nr:sugar ABC transporter permease [Propionibacteriaceae bacterium]